MKLLLLDRESCVHWNLNIKSSYSDHNSLRFLRGKMASVQEYFNNWPNDEGVSEMYA